MPAGEAVLDMDRSWPLLCARTRARARARARARYLVGKIFRAWSTPREKVENHLSIGHF